MRPTCGQQIAIVGLSALAHLSAAGWLLASMLPPPAAPPKPLPVIVTLIPLGSAPSSAPAAAPGASGAPPASEVAPPLPVRTADAPMPSKTEPKPKLKTVSKRKPKLPVESRPEPKPKPILATQAPLKPVTRATSPTPAADSAASIRLAQQGAMLNSAGVAADANGAAAPAKTGAGLGLQGTVTDGHAAGDRQPTPVYRPEPVYPAFARRLGHEGRVVIRIHVLSSGVVAAAHIERSSGYAALDEAALATIKRWRFRPAQRGGQPVDATLNVPITFKLQEQG